MEIARAISSNARLLILDEATSSLSETATLRLLEIVRDLSSQGVAIVMITHRMPELYASCSRAIVMRDGMLVGHAPLPSTTEQALVQMMVGRELGDYYGSRNAKIGDVTLRVRDLETFDGALAPTSLTVRAGEILGVAGLVGSGKSEFGMALGGAIRSRWDVRVREHGVPLGNPYRAITSGIGYVPDDRRAAAILPFRSVGENLALAWLEHSYRLGFLRRRTERKRIEQTIRRYAVKTSSAEKEISLLSGGNQQKAILGRTFSRNCPVYVLNEPTRGVDIGSKSTIYGFLQRLAEDGAAIVLISSELPELIGLADRVAVFFEGNVKAILEGEHLNEREISALAVSGQHEA